MKKRLILKGLICLATVLFAFNLNTTQAQTDDARVLGGISRSTDIFTYLNTYPYKLWQSDHRFAPDIYNDLYLSEDKCVAVDLWNDSLGQIFLLGPGYKTDKGIEVGMTMNDVEYAYGPIYDSSKAPRDYTQRYGIYTDYGNDGYYKKYRAYGVIEYVSPNNEGLNFVIDKKTKKIVLIMYQANRHGNGTAMSYVKLYNLLPERN
ncbi:MULTISPECIES: hypothetical protein [Bacillota]|uniref:hypothetical protein n=1 Tax=Bacillota TaxID=1239 RepID=UPI00210DB2DF|nr:hypothetical protein [Megasphaera massiliensis]MCQ5209250.1 hypothetical protein [Megasphaera massiliensis]